MKLWIHAFQTQLLDIYLKKEYVLAKGKNLICGVTYRALPFDSFMSNCIFPIFRELNDMYIDEDYDENGPVCNFTIYRREGFGYKPIEEICNVDYSINKMSGMATVVFFFY